MITKLMIEGAKNWAAANKSDPFAYRRALTHVAQGLCAPLQDGRDGHYSAEPYQEERFLPDGRPYMVTVYKNLVRP